MPSFQDSAFLILLALLLFGPRGLAKLARELGKLMGEFRRASSEFRMQMEDEFRQVEQAEQQKKIAAMEAAAPLAPAFAAPEIGVLEVADPEHPHMPSGEIAAAPEETVPVHHIDGRSEVEALPIASTGELDMMPPATGLPQGRSSATSASSASLSGVFDSIPQAPERLPEHLPGPEPAHSEIHHG